MTSNQRIAGVIGGMGPDATVDFMARILALSDATQDQDHVRLLVDQNPGIPNRQDALLRSGENPGPCLAEMARGLEKSGADFLVMPCNTAHAFQDHIIEAVDIPFISIVDVTLDGVGADACAGVLATRGCVDANVFQPALQEAAIDHLMPDPAEADELTRIAFEIKRGNRGADVARQMRELADKFVAAGANILIAACTEIPLVLAADDIDVPLLSSTDELARRTIALARGDVALNPTGKE